MRGTLKKSKQIITNINFSTRLKKVIFSHWPTHHKIYIYFFTHSYLISLSVVGASTEIISARVFPSQRVCLFDLKFLTVPQGIKLSSINFRLQNVTYNCDTKLLDVHTVPSSSFELIPGVFAISDGVVSLRMNLSKSKDSNAIIAFSGQWTLGSLKIDVLARYDNRDKILLLRGAPKQGFSVNLQKMINDLTGTFVPVPLPSFSLTNIAVTGEIELTEGGQVSVVVSGSIDKNRVHAIFQKPLTSGKFSGAFAADFGPFKLSDLVSKATEVDISDVPFFGKLSIPRLGVIISTDYITSFVLPLVFCREGLLQHTGVSVAKGLTAFMKLNLGGENIPLKLRYIQSSMIMEVIDGGRLTINSLMSSIPGVDINSLLLPHGIRDILRLQVSLFSLDTNSKELEVDTKLPGSLSYFNDYLTITDLSMNIHADLEDPRKLYLEVDGTIKIGKRDYEITVARNSNEYVLRASFKTIPVSDFIHKFSATFLPEEFQNTLKQYIQFSIHDAKFAFPLGTRKYIHLSGTPVIGDYKTVDLTAVFTRQERKINMIAGFQFQWVNLANIIKQITGKDLREIAILNQNLDIALVISPVNLQEDPLYDSKHSTISKGVTIQASLQWPHDCSQDQFCAVAQRCLGKDARLSLQGTIESSTRFTLSASIITNISLGSGVSLQQAALQVTVGEKRQTIGIEGSIYLKDPDITVYAGIRVGRRGGPPGVFLEGNAKGCWRRAFSAKWLTICNFHLLIGVEPTGTIIGALELGGQFTIGDSCISDPIMFAGYIGLDELTPKNNYYYVKMNDTFTVSRVLQALCITVSLPQPLADSGFPHGLESSYSLTGKEIKTLGISIPSGYRLKGTIRILGLDVQADVTINSEEVKMDIALPPLNIGEGHIQMYISRNDKSHGPFLKVSLTVTPPNVYMEASGYVSVLGIQTDTKLKITNTQYEYKISGSLLGLYEASLHITARYKDIKTAKFQVHGQFKDDFFTTVEKLVNGGFQKSAKDATTQIEKAKMDKNAKNARLLKQTQKQTDAHQRMIDANKARDRAISKLRAWQRKLQRACSIVRCRTSESNA